MNKTFCDQCGAEIEHGHWSKGKFEINNNTDNNGFEAELCFLHHKQFKADVLKLGANWKKPLELSTHEIYEDVS